MKKYIKNTVANVLTHSCLFGISTIFAVHSAQATNNLLKTQKKELPEHYFTYVAQKGDTLWKITDKYLKNPQQWKLIQTINQVADPKKLMPLQTIRIPDYSIKTELLPVAILQQKGEVFFSENNRVIQTNKGSAIVKLNDGSLITIFPESIIKVLKHDKTGENVVTDISVEKGKMHTQVAKQLATSRFDVRTPLAVAGVRGTAFQIRVESAKATFTEMDEGKVQLTSTVPTTIVQTSDDVVGGYAAKSTPEGNVVEKRPSAVDLSQLPKNITDAEIHLKIPTLAITENVTNYKIELSEKQPDFMNPILVKHITQNELEKQGLKLGDLPNDNYFLRVTGIMASGIEGISSTHQFTRVKTIPKKPVMIDLNPIAEKINYEFDKNRLSKIHLGVPFIGQENNQLMVYWQQLPKQNYEIVLQKVHTTNLEKLIYETELQPLTLHIKNDNKILFPASLKTGNYTLQIKGFSPLDDLYKKNQYNNAKKEQSEIILLHVPEHFFNAHVEITSAVIDKKNHLNYLQDIK